MSLEQGQSIELKVTPDPFVTVRYAGASGDFNPIHIDEEFARSVGLPGRILHGLWTMAQVARAHTDAAGGPESLRSLSVQFQETGKNLVTDVVGPSVAPRLLLSALAIIGVLLVVLIVEEELTFWLDVRPAVGVEDGSVHQLTGLADPQYVRRLLVCRVYRIAERRQPRRA